jgi:hypothetical protein
LQELITIDPGISVKIAVEAGRFNPGEASTLSKIVKPGARWQNDGVQLLPYSTFKISPSETVLANSQESHGAGSGAR